MMSKNKKNPVAPVKSVETMTQELRSVYKQTRDRIVNALEAKRDKIKSTGDPLGEAKLYDEAINSYTRASAIKHKGETVIVPFPDYTKKTAVWQTVESVIHGQRAREQHDDAIQALKRANGSAQEFQTAQAAAYNEQKAAIKTRSEQRDKMAKILEASDLGIASTGTLRDDMDTPQRGPSKPRLDEHITHMSPTASGTTNSSERDSLSSLILTEAKKAGKALSSDISDATDSERSNTPTPRRSGSDHSIRR